MRAWCKSSVLSFPVAVAVLNTCRRDSMPPEKGGGDLPLTTADINDFPAPGTKEVASDTCASNCANKYVYTILLYTWAYMFPRAFHHGETDVVTSPERETGPN
jgi:hypothetical protein